MAKLVFIVYNVIFFVSVVCIKDIYFENGLDESPAGLSRPEQHPANDFTHHTLVKPKIYHGREKRQISTTKQEDGQHTNHLQISLEIDGEILNLDLTLNKDLIPQGFFQKHQENGQYKIHNPTAQEVDLCQYKGKVRGKANSWVALSTCDGLSGVIFDGTEMHYIEKGTKANPSEIEAPHYLYKHSNLIDNNNKTCGYKGDAIDPEHHHDHVDNRFLRYKRDAEPSERVRGPYNANKESKFVELVLVLDNREFKEMEGSKTKVLNHAKNIANIINGLYSPLNIFIALVGVVIWSENDEIQFSSDGDTTLTNFLHYRREKLIKTHPNDNAQLLTKFNFENGVVGKALKGPICTYEFSGGVNTDHSPVVGLVATTVAHEMGHNFGMEHDTNECKCPDDRCIMAPSSSTVAPTHWSSCSLNYLILAFTHGMDYCLKNKPVSLFDSPICGNGFVEPGEQCDCGLPEHCDNYCCNATTCMLHANASCATGECCDLSTCLPKNAGTLCRSADYECDLPEYCSGQSEYCPPDIYKLDAEACDGGKAYCYKGFCRTRTDQCKLLWGETGKSSDDQCYMMNTKGTRHGNCGYNKLTQSFFKCDNESVLCGMLHCKHLNERLEFGMESVSILSHTFINKKGSIIPCRTAIVDLGINQVDPGLTPDGALCGEGKMCVNQRCMSVSNLRRQGPTCPQDCNGNGWCNSKGHCHCKDGFAPPHCDYPGPGGSLDSGPASDPNARQGVIAALFIIFLGIVPLIAIIVLLSYYARQNFRFGWKKSSTSTSKSPSKPRGTSFPSETAKRTEDNHSLLHEDTPPPMGFDSAFFGNFKGFSIAPTTKKQREPEPVRAAPPPPVVPSSNTGGRSQTKTSFLSKPIQKYNSFRNNSFLCGSSNSNNTATPTSNSITSTHHAAPALPPPNPGSHARPIISSPVLEASTCTAKELISPLRNAPTKPVRSAPEVPVPPAGENTRPLSVPVAPAAVLDVPPCVKIEEVKKPTKEPFSSSGTLNRIASFLKPSDKKPVVVHGTNLSSKPSQHKVTKALDKESLRKLEISGPIPQTKIDITIISLPKDNETSPNKPVVMRAQSMRAPKAAPKPNIQTFGSMRQPSGYKRPLSIPAASRPKSPPPPRPADLPSSQKSLESDQYDDCLNEEIPLSQLSSTNHPSGDNIYAVIEESPASPLSPQTVKSSNSGSSESMGLLGEIVSEIQNRNFDSIYSTSTLARKKREAEEKLRKENLAKLDNSDGGASAAETYVNTSTMQYPDGEYSNMSGMKSNASTTSSGYILPSAINVPVREPVEKKAASSEEKAKPVLSSFKSDSTKPFSSTFNRPQGPLASNTKPTGVKKVDTSPERSNKSKGAASPTRTAAAKSLVSRQTTPPNLRTRRPSPPGGGGGGAQLPKSNRSVSNSPDLVTSCNENASKAPDVLVSSTVSKKPSPITAKPVVNSLPKGPVKPNLKSVSFKSAQEKKAVEVSKPPVSTKVGKTVSDVTANSKTPVGLRNAARSSSNVASLQQKFENKNNVANNNTIKNAKSKT